MSEGQVRLEISGSIARIYFDRPAALNSMTWQMYAQFEDVCDRLVTPGPIRAVVLRGAGGRAFVAGSDIAQFTQFQSGEDGVAYEHKMDRILDKLSSIPVPTLAVIEGLAVGGGLNIAGACDLRIATDGARFGVPIARTLGNCLSARNYARMASAFGVANAKRMLFLADLLNTDDLAGSGFLARVVTPEALDETIENVVTKLCSGAPLSIAASKAALNRLKQADLPDIDDLIQSCYASNDFHEGIRAFGEKRKPGWSGT